MTNRCPDRAKKKSKRRSPTQQLFVRVRVYSLANGNMRVEPVWRGVKLYTPEDGGGPGLMSRLAGAVRLERLINRHLKDAP